MAIASARAGGAGCDDAGSAGAQAGEQLVFARGAAAGWFQNSSTDNEELELAEACRLGGAGESKVEVARRMGAVAARGSAA